MDNTIDRMLDTMADLHTSTDLDSSIFYGFTNEEICYVSSDVWDIKPKLRSCSIQIHHEDAFNNLETEVKQQYGPPQSMANNGNIYRGLVKLASGNSVQVIITFYKTTLLVRVQGSGYAMWVNKVLPSLAEKVMSSYRPVSPQLKASCPSTPLHNSTPIRSSTSPQHRSLHELLQSALTATEHNASVEKENNMLKDRVDELKNDNAKLQSMLTEKTVQIEMMMTRIAEVDLLEFESDCNLKLLEATEAKFADERQQLLQQIQDLSNTKQDCDKCRPSPESPPVPTYSEVVRWSKAKQRTRKIEPTQPAPVENRFSVLEVENDQPAAEVSESGPALPAEPTVPSANDHRENCATGSTRRKRTDSKSRCPKLVLFGDSIGRRINPQRLSRNADIKNLCVGGRKIERVSQDIKDSDLSNVDSVITHVGTNNLVTDSEDTLTQKLEDMCNHLKRKVPEGCEVALSSIVMRNDKPGLSSKLNKVNRKMEDICVRNNWTYIDNAAVTSLHKDKLHPDEKGMSFLARNFQDFLRCAHPSIFRQGRKQNYHRRNLLNHNHIPAWLKHLMQPYRR